MRGERPGWAAIRAVIAVAVLYVLALQGVMGAALASSVAGPAHSLCLQVPGQAEDGHGGPSTPHAHLPCCTAVHLQHAADAPILPSAAIVWPLRRGISGPAWRAEAVAQPRAPPRSFARARAPPAA